MADGREERSEREAKGQRAEKEQKKTEVDAWSK